jgi:uncharacterized repeat protein (TIGR04076 family)
MRYKLYDLEITTTGDPKTFNCSHVVGDGFIIKGENIAFKSGTKQFSHYALATLIPYIAAKQRANQKEDWMTYETDIACPDPQCGARFRFKRFKEVTYEYSPI